MGLGLRLGLGLGSILIWTILRSPMFSRFVGFVAAAHDLNKSSMTAGLG